MHDWVKAFEKFWTHQLDRIKALTHRAMGLIPQEDREGVVEGREHKLQRIRELAERRALAPGGRR